jgi:glucan 1,3-beta-glucosidase
LDSHPYLCFGGQSNAPMSSYATTPCSTWGAAVNTSMAAFGLTTAGEFSNAVTDCGLWVNGVGLGTRYEGTYPGTSTKIGSCTEWTDWQNYTPDTKQAITAFALASMDALQNWFFWTWKIGNSTVSGKVEAPAWSYKLGLDQGWMPTDPRQALGVCQNAQPWQPPLSAWQTGGAGAGNIDAVQTSSYTWPPSVISGTPGNPASLLPSYTPTGVVPTLPPPTLTASATASAGNGWANPADTAGLMVPIGTCSYLDPWVGSAPLPQPLCTGGAGQGTTATPPVITPSPS